MRDRAKKFAIDVVKFIDGLTQSRSTNVFGNQLIRSASSVGANYRAALRARSGEEFIAKLAIVLEEADEPCYWLELILALHPQHTERIAALSKEANELTAMTVTSLKTKKANLAASRTPSKI